MKKNSDTKPLPETPKPNIPPKKRRLKNNYVCRWTIEKTTNKRNKKGFLIFF